MGLPLVCTLEPTDGARQQLRDRAERNAQHFRNLAIPQPIMAQMETLALTFGQRVEHAAQPMPTFAIDETLLGIGPGINDQECRLKAALNPRGFPKLSCASLER
jgi:hypothetical protein